MDYTIDFLDKVAKASTAQIAAEFEKYGYKNPPKFSNAMVRIVLENAAQQSVQRTGGTQIEVSVSCSKCGNQTPFTIEIPASR